MDPEQFGEVIHRYLGRVAEVVRSYEGDVARYLGDGVLVHFGWPEAHDDDAERAVRAALDIIADLDSMNWDLPSSSQLRVRIGIHTGPVMIGEIRGSPNQETISLGETLNLASRLQAVAPPNGVVLSTETKDLVRGIFVIEALGPQTLKGMPGPVEVFRAVQPTGVRSRLDAAPERLTPLVGRTREVARVMELWEEARSGVGGRAVLIPGEAGVGKSRLVHELRIRVRDQPHSWLECRCSSYTRQSAFRPAVELIENGLRLRPTDDPQEKLEKLERGLSIAGIDPRAAVGLLAPLLSLPVAEGAHAIEMSPEQRRRSTLAFLVDWVLALTKPQPMVLLTEDVHWADPSSLELFGELIASGAGHRLLIVATARPEFVAPWPKDRMPEVLAVEPLHELEARAMVARLSQGSELPEAVLSRIVEETDGIPLFIEEIGRSVLESSELPAGSEQFHIPTSLQASLMARLDRLSAAKRVAQQASVIGREFGSDLLQQIADLEPGAVRLGLERLVQDELLYKLGEGQDATYTFKHALIQDAAYQSLLRRTRAKLHGRIARVLERAAEVEPPGTPEVVARHFEAAGLAEPAVIHYRRAAAQAVEKSGHREAIAHLRKAIELLERLPEDRSRDEAEIQLQMGLASSLIAMQGYADPDVRTAYERGHALAERHALGSATAHALVGLSIYHSNQGEVHRGEELARRVLAIAEREDDDTLRLLARVELAVPTSYQGRFQEALAHCQHALEVYDPGRHRSLAFRFGTDHGVAAHGFASLALCFLGHTDRALAHSRDGVELAKSLGQPFNLAYAHLAVTTTHWLRGDTAAQETAAAAMTAVSEEQGFDLFIGVGRMFRAAAQACASRDPETIPELVEGAMKAAETGLRGAVPAFMIVMAEAQRETGDTDGAVEAVEGALELAEETGQLGWNARLHSLRGDLHLDASEDDEAAVCFRRAVAVAEAQGARLEELRATTRLARLMHGRGVNGEPARLLEAAYERFPEDSAIADLIEARELLETLRASSPVRP
jgi:class 3 adenylate cyclase/tetratricopeptide (TPR) repeat protein